MAIQPTDTILIIDDDAAKRHSIAKILLKSGFSILEANTGTEGLRLAAQKPSLIILDVKLPDMSGFAVCQRIKEDPATRTIPVLHISTTFVGIEDRIQGLEGGADGYLTDVLEPLELVANVRSLLRARRAEEAAEISSRQWQVTFDAINDGVILLGREGRAVQINSAMEKLIDKSWNDLQGLSIHELLCISPTLTDSPFLRMLASGHREATDLTLTGRWLRVTVDPIRDVSGVVKGGICIVTDITDRRRLEEELRRRADELATADRRKDEFLAMLAHELRNPLAPIANALEGIRLGRAYSPETEESLSIAGRQVSHMAHLLDDLLDVSRFTRGNIHLRKETVDLVWVLNQAIEISRPMIAAGSHALITSFPDFPVYLEGDPTRLAQILANLLNNAAKYTDSGGRIELNAEIIGQEVVIRVRDNGVGLSADMLPRVFDLFSQEDRSLDRSQGGLGIGLTLVHSLVRLHGGTVSAESQGLDQGSEFIVRLPVSTATQDAEAARQNRSRAVHEADRMLRILVVDDSVDSARSLARVLRLWGNDVAVAHDGAKAIEVVSSKHLDVILLDIGLPGMDGYEVAERLREQFGSARPVLIALTGYGQQEDLLKSKDVGFDAHFVKPVSFDLLKDRLSDPVFLMGRDRRRIVEPELSSG